MRFWGHGGGSGNSTERLRDFDNWVLSRCGIFGANLGHAEPMLSPCLTKKTDSFTP